MSVEGYEAFDDPYVYPGTSILKNLLDLQDAESLEAFEIEISTLRAEEPLPEGIFDAEHLRNIHHHLFQDVYAWAGEYRTVRTSKDGNVFCYPENIARQMNTLFSGIEHGNRFRGQTPDVFVHRLASFIAELNAIHPFREGNGRAQLAFLGLIAASFDHPLQLEKLDRRTFLPAMVSSFTGDLSALIAELALLL